MRWRITVVLLGWALALMAPCRGQTPSLAWSPGGPAMVTGTVAGTTASGTPLAGPVDALALASNGVVFAGGAGGVWSFAPATNAWTAVSDGAPVGALAVAGGDLYAGTGSIVTPGRARAGSGILMSSDGGGHWTTLGAATFAGLAITRIAVDPSQASHLLAVAVSPAGGSTAPSPGLYASNDGGMTWSPMLSGEVWDAVWNASGSAVLVAEGTSAGTVLEISPTDGGPFVPLALGSTPPGRVALSPRPGGGFLAFWGGAQPGLAAIGADGSATMLPLPADVSVGTTTGLAVNCDSAHIWIGAADVWESSDNGQSWTDLSLGLPVAAQQHALANAVGGGVWVGNDGGVWMAPAGGGLQNKNAGLNNEAPVALALTASGAAAAWAGDSDGVGAGALAATAAWSADGSHMFSSLAASGNAVYGAPRGSAALLASSDGGQTWGTANLAPGAVTGVINALAATGAAVWLGTSTGEIWTSGDSGASWTQLASPAAVGTGITALAAGGGALWLAAGENLWSSADGGQSWEPAPDPGGVVSALAAAPAHPGEAAAVTPAGPELLYAGAWTPLAPLAAPPTALAWDGSDTLWAATFGRGFWSLPLAQYGLQISLAPTAANAVAGQSTAIDFTVQASDLAGSAAGIAVTLTSGAAWTASATTGATGAATVPFPVPDTAGDVTVLAMATNQARDTATVHVVPAALSRVLIVAGGSASAAVGTVLDLTIATEDRYGNPVAGVDVVLSGPGTFSPAAVTTNADGRASIAYTLPAVPGDVTITATAGDIAATWQETALPPPSYSLVLTPPPAALPPGQSTATVMVQVIPGAGGYSAPVTFQNCQPAPGCTFSAASVSPPYLPVTMTVDLSARTADQSTLDVMVTTDANHSVTVPVPLQGFTLAASTATLAVTAGQTSAPVVLTLTPVNGMAGNVDFAATAADSDTLPSWMAPQFTPGSLALPARSTANFSISTASAAAGAVGGTWWPGGWGCWPGPLLALLFWGGLAAVKRKRGWRLAFVLGMGLAAAGCGGGGGGGTAPPPAPAPAVSTYTLQLTASAGGLHASVPVQVSVTTP